MLQKKEIILLVTGIFIGVVVGLVAGYGIHDSPAQGDMSGLAGAADNNTSANGQINVGNRTSRDLVGGIEVDGIYYGH